MNPRVSRSSALASKATGFPIARIGTKVAVGYRLDELPNDITRTTPASFEPVLDYVVVKIPRFAFEKFPAADPTLTTQMKSVGEVMAIGRTFKEAFQKGLRGLEVDRAGWTVGGTAGRRPAAGHQPGGGSGRDPDARRRSGSSRSSTRCSSGIGRGHRRADRHRSLVPVPAGRAAGGGGGVARGGARAWRQRDCRTRGRAPQDEAAGILRPAAGRSARHDRDRDPGRAPSRWASGRPTRRWTPAPASSPPRRRTSTPPTTRRTRLGPAASAPWSSWAAAPTGSGREWSSTTAACGRRMAFRELGYRTVMVNSNPETVSTDFDISDALYFEPLTLEDVLEIVAAGAAHRRGGPARRADPAPAGPGAGARRACRSWAPRPRPSIWRKTAAGSRRSPGSWAWPSRPAAWRTRSRRRWRWPPGSAIRCWSVPPTCWAAGPWRSSTTTARSGATSRGRRGWRRSIRCSSTASWRTPSRPTSMPSPTGPGA